MISEVTVAGIADEVARQGVDETVIAALRRDYSGIHFTYCSDDDITSGKPVLEREGFNIYLVDGREHCLCLTNDFDVATGIVVAEVYDDEAD